MITQRYFISTGKKEAMFTLWVKRESDDPIVNRFIEPVYLRNLANVDGEDRAIEKAKEYVDAMRERIATADCKVEFAGVWDEPTFKRRGKLSVADTLSLEAIEDGKFPFGKHAGTRFEDAPDSYVLYWADQLPHASNLVTATLAGACQGVALEKGYIAKRDAARAARAEADALSQHIGTVGERRTFEGEVVTSFFKANPWGGTGGYFINRVRCGNDLVVAMGSVKLGEVGQVVRFKATVKGHEEYKGVLSTKVNRPKIEA